MAKANRLVLVVLGLAVALAAVSSTVWYLVIGPVSDDYSQIAAGRQILAHGIPAADTLAWTSDAVRPPLVPHEWLYQAAVAVLYGIGGFAAIEGFLTLVRLGVFLLIAWIAWKRSRKPWVAVATVLVTGSLLALSQTAASKLLSLASRPQTLSILLLLGVVALLERGGRWRWGIVPLLALGTNWHGGFWPLYVLVVGYYAVRERDWKLPLALLALLASPAGLRVLPMPFAYSGGIQLTGNPASEWGRTFFWPMEAGGVVPFLSFGLLLGGIYLARPRWEDAGFLAALMVLALSGQRFTVFPVVLGLPLLAGYWDRLETALPGRGTPALRLGLALFAFVVPGLLLGSIVGANAAVGLGRPPRQDLPYRTVGTSTADLNPVLDYVRSRGLQRVLNTSIPEGDYMAFTGLRPFIYNRTDAFLVAQPDGKSLWAEFYAARADPTLLDGLARKYGAAYVLDQEGGTTTASGGFSEYLASRPQAYRPVFRHGTVVLYAVEGAGLR